MCSQCEDSSEHEHPMLKLKTPDAFIQYLLHLKDRERVGDYLNLTSSSIFNLPQHDKKSESGFSRDDDQDLNESSDKVNMLAKSIDSDPLIESEEEKEEFPEMVKRSALHEYKPFGDNYINTLKVKVVEPEVNQYTVNKNSSTFDVFFKLSNNDSENSSRWPINSTIKCMSPSQNEIVSCNPTIKEVRTGVVVQLHATFRTPKDKQVVEYTFRMVDEYGREFGEIFSLKVKFLDANIVNVNDKEAEDEESAFSAIHDADTMYPQAVANLKEMGVDSNEAKDLLMKFQGDISKVFDSM